MVIWEQGGWKEASWVATGSCLVGLVAGDRAEHGLCGAFGGVDVGAERRGVVIARHAGGERLAGVVVEVAVVRFGLRMDLES